MFVGFFFLLRSRKIPVTITEWLMLLDALKQGFGDESLLGFYYLCRALCVKSESLFDTYDQCFLEYFKGVEIPTPLKDEFLDWLKNAKLPDLDALRARTLKDWDMAKIREEFEKRLREQTSRHDGGDRWVGTGGSSPYGNSGFFPGGIRAGGGGGQSSAAQVASLRSYQDLRHDRVLDTRSISLALKKLRTLGRVGLWDELDLDGTIAQTANNGGDIELKFQPPRRNTIKLLLLMDIGGSMTPYTQLCERIFTAAYHAKHFKAFKYFYFHNCPYDYLFANMREQRMEQTNLLLKSLDPTWNLIIVGDAAMHPYELTSQGGSVSYYQYNEETGLTWLKRIRDRLPRSVWLNPEKETYWDIPSTRMIREIFSDMYPLTIKGLTEAIKFLSSRTD